MGINRNRISRAARGYQRGSRRGIGNQEVTVSGLSPVRFKKGLGFTQTVYGTNLNLVHRDGDGVSRGQWMFWVQGGTANGSHLYLLTPNAQGLLATPAEPVLMKGTKNGQPYTWSFGPGDLGSKSLGISSGTGMAQASGRNRARMSRFGNVRRR